MSSAERPTTFKDTTGTTWDLKITMASALAIDNDTDFSNLTKLDTFCFLNLESDRDSLSELEDNRSLKCFVCYMLLKDQVDTLLPQENEDERQHAFMARLDAETLVRMEEALEVALSRFCPQIKTVLLMYREEKKKTIEKANERLSSLQEKLEQVTDKEVDTLIDKIDGELSGLLSENSDGPSTKSPVTATENS